MNFIENRRLIFLAFSFFAFLGNCYSEGAKKEANLRDGATRSAIQELHEHTKKEITDNYFGDCANYEMVGRCIRPFPYLIRPMMRYYVPFQLTESNVRPDATAFIERQAMKQITKRAFDTIERQLEQEFIISHRLINQQNSDPKLDFSGEVNKEFYEKLKEYHNKDESFIGLSAEDGQTASYSVGSNHEWHKEMLEKYPFLSIPEDPRSWCHDFTPLAPSGKTGDHPAITAFSSLGVFNPKTPKERLIPLIAYFQRYSHDRRQFPDLAKRTPKPGQPNKTACYQKRQKNGIGHPEFFGGGDNPVVPRQQQGKEQSPEVCPGFGFQGPAGPFWIFGKTYFPAGNAMMASLRGLIVAWSTTVKNSENKKTVDHETGRHRLYTYDREYNTLHKSDYLQRIWPRPPLKGWQKGCADTKAKGFYIPPQVRPEDNQEANIVKDENFGSHYRFAHYSSIVCCPTGFIPDPFPGVALKEG